MGMSSVWISIIKIDELHQSMMRRDEVNVNSIPRVPASGIESSIGILFTLKVSQDE